MQHTPQPDGKRVPAGIFPLNADFRPGGEDEKWPEDPQIQEFETENDPDALREDPQGGEADIDDIDDQWEQVIREYKIY